MSHKTIVAAAAAVALLLVCAVHSATAIQGTERLRTVISRRQHMQDRSMLQVHDGTEDDLALFGGASEASSSSSASSASSGGRTVTPKTLIKPHYVEDAHAAAAPASDTVTANTVTESSTHDSSHVSPVIESAEASSEASSEASAEASSEVTSESSTKDLVEQYKADLEASEKQLNAGHHESSVDTARKEAEKLVAEAVTSEESTSHEESAVTAEESAPVVAEESTSESTADVHTRLTKLEEEVAELRSELHTHHAPAAKAEESTAEDPEEELPSKNDEVSGMGAAETAAAGNLEQVVEKAAEQAAAQVEKDLEQKTLDEAAKMVEKTTVIIEEDAGMSKAAAETKAHEAVVAAEAEIKAEKVKEESTPEPEAEEPQTPEDKLAKTVAEKVEARIEAKVTEIAENVAKHTAQEVANEDSEESSEESSAAAKHHAHAKKSLSPELLEQDAEDEIDQEARFAERSSRKEARDVLRVALGEEQPLPGHTLSNFDIDRLVNQGVTRHELSKTLRAAREGARFKQLGLGDNVDDVDLQ